MTSTSTSPTLHATQGVAPRWTQSGADVERSEPAHVQPRMPRRLSDPQDHRLAGGAAHDHARSVGVHVILAKRGCRAARSAPGLRGCDVEDEYVRQWTCSDVTVESSGLLGHGVLLSRPRIVRS